jgi:hypothetical protein
MPVFRTKGRVWEALPKKYATRLIVHSCRTIPKVIQESTTGALINQIILFNNPPGLKMVFAPGNVVFFTAYLKTGSHGQPAFFPLRPSRRNRQKAKN